MFFFSPLNLKAKPEFEFIAFGDVSDKACFVTVCGEVSVVVRMRLANALLTTSDRRDDNFHFENWFCCCYHDRWTHTQ